MAGAAFATQVGVLVGIAIAMTVGVYGLVAGIVKLDDAGLWLAGRTGDGSWPRFQRGLGATILRVAPWFMKALSVAGTAAMFLVGGGILTHGVPVVHHAIAAFFAEAGSVPAVGGVLAAVGPLLADMVVGVVVGALILGAVVLVQRLRPARDAHG